MISALCCAAESALRPDLWLSTKNSNSSVVTRRTDSDTSVVLSVLLSLRFGQTWAQYQELTVVLLLVEQTVPKFGSSVMLLLVEQTVITALCWFCC